MFLWSFSKVIQTMANPGFSYLLQSIGIVPYSNGQYVDVSVSIWEL